MKVWQVAIVKTSGTARSTWRREVLRVGIYGSLEVALRVKIEQERMLKWAPRPDGERFRVELREG